MASRTITVDGSKQLSWKLQLLIRMILMSFFFTILYKWVTNKEHYEEPPPQPSAGYKLPALYIQPLSMTAATQITFPPKRCPTFPRFNLTVCIHDLEKDIYISGFLSRGRMWEAGLVNHIRKWLTRSKSFTLIDIGSNIGLYSLAAAGVGHKALAVEPMPDNLELLEASIAKSKLQNTITVIPFAVSDGYYNMSLETDVKNQGRTVLRSTPCKPSANISCTWTRTIMLDDLLTVPNFMYKNSVMKIDIEGHEIPTMMAGVKFWQELNIPVILMEWQWVPLLFKDGSLTNQKVNEYLDFMNKLNYTALNSGNGAPLKRDLWKKWANDIVWSQPGFKF